MDEQDSGFQTRTAPPCDSTGSCACFRIAHNNLARDPKLPGVAWLHRAPGHPLFGPVGDHVLSTHYPSSRASTAVAQGRRGDQIRSRVGKPLPVGQARPCQRVMVDLAVSVRNSRLQHGCEREVLIGAIAIHNDFDGAQEDDNVIPEGPVLDIPGIQIGPIGKSGF